VSAQDDRPLGLVVWARGDEPVHRLVGRFSRLVGRSGVLADYVRHRAFASARERRRVKARLAAMRERKRERRRAARAAERQRTPTQGATL